MAPNEADTQSDQDAEVNDSRMSFVEHLRELRTRIRNSIMALLVGFAIAYAFKQELFFLLLQPLLEAWDRLRAANPSIGAPELHFGSLIEPFWTYFSLALWAGIFIASPFIFHQLWKFIAPGLYKRERRFGVLFAGSSAISFIGGAVFCYFFVLPVVYDFLLGYSTSNIAQVSQPFGIDYTMGDAIMLHPTLFMRDYLDFSRKLLLGFGIVFELPLLIFCLAAMGMVTHRGLWKFNRWWIVVAFTFSAVLTPPDVMSQILMAGPLVVLYNLSIGIAWLVTRKREKRDASLE